METIYYQDKEIILIKTAHVSKASSEEVRQVISEYQPDTVCIELDENRAANLFKKTDYSQMKLSQVIREKKVALVVMNYVLSQYQKKMADHLETQVGDEMRVGVTMAQSQKAHLNYIDRDIQITFKRIWSYLSFIEKVKLISALIGSLFDSETIEESQIEELKQQDILEDALAEVTQAFPTISRILISERDMYMAQSIKESPGKKIVAVIGAAHAPGMIKQLQQPEINKEKLLTIKPKSLFSKLLPWMLPLALIALVFLTNNSWQELSGWLLTAAVASAIGAALCLAHPLTILVSFVAAPISTLSPVLAVGWFAGLCEATLRQATVSDFNSLNDDSKSIKKVLKNNILRTLAIMLMTSLFSSIVTIVFSFDIVRQFIVQLFT